VTFNEKPRSDKLPVAINHRELLVGLAGPFPPFWNKAEILVREATPFGPDSSVGYTDDTIGSIVRI
jgi:hypothetical protein